MITVVDTWNKKKRGNCKCKQYKRLQSIVLYKSKFKSWGSRGVELPLSSYYLDWKSHTDTYTKV